MARPLDAADLMSFLIGIVWGVLGCLTALDVIERRLKK